MRKLKTVLVVDDDESALFVAKRVLERMEIAQEILTATNGLDGFLLVREACSAPLGRVPDLILVDLKMPVMNGFKMIEAMEGLDFKKKPVIVVLTSSESSIDREKARNLKTDAYLVKPVQAESVEKILEELLDWKTIPR